jgi:hypothetical protein
MAICSEALRSNIILPFASFEQSCSIVAETVNPGRMEKPEEGSTHPTNDTSYIIPTIGYMYQTKQD